jgi:hypothetical protein
MIARPVSVVLVAVAVVRVVAFVAVGFPVSTVRSVPVAR